jgi:hypothetical protein
MDAFRSLGRGDWIVSRACQERCSRVRRWHAIRGLLFPRTALAHFKVGAVFTDDHDWHTPDLDLAWRRTPAHALGALAITRACCSAIASAAWAWLAPIAACITPSALAWS